MPRKVALDDPTRLYQNDFAERITRAHFLEPLILFIPPALALLVYAFGWGPLHWSWNLAYFALGVLVWTFSEYFLHRFLFHFEPQSEGGQKVKRLIHGIHHEFPNDTDRLVIPPMTSIPVTSFYAIGYYLIAGWWVAIPLLAGSMLGYVYYDFVHYSTHHLKPRTPWAKAQRRRHLLHHYKYPDACFGVSTGLWDWIFRTTEKNARQAVFEGRMVAYEDSNWKIIDNDIT